MTVHIRRGLVCCAAALAFSLLAVTQAYAATVSVDRIYGTEASDTAAEIAQRSATATGGAVVLARDNDYMDAMSATGLAGALHAPILLTNQEYLSPATASEIARLQPSVVYIIGGKAAIKPAVEEALGVTAVRVFGTEACDTSVACAKLIEQLNERDGIATSGRLNSEDTAIVATSVGFADALSVSSYAYKYRLPIFIVGSMTDNTATDRKLPSEAVSMLEGYGTVFVPGGTGALPDSSLTSCKDKVQRIYGTDGYETSFQVAWWLTATGRLGSAAVGVASGDEAPMGVDALASASLCAANDAPLVLADKDATNISLAFQLLSMGDSLQQIYIFGGSAVVSSDAFTKFCNLFESSSVDPCPPTVKQEPYVASPSEIVSIAASRVGCAYQAGGNGPDAFDCSGLVYWVFNQGGWNITRTSAAGYASLGERIDAGAAQAGDLVMYYERDGSVFHVAIYDGNGRVYEAVNERLGVKYNDVSYCDVVNNGHFFVRLSPQPSLPDGGLGLSSYNGMTFCSACWMHVSQGDFVAHCQSVHGINYSDYYYF